MLKTGLAKEFGTFHEPKQTSAVAKYRAGGGLKPTPPIPQLSGNNPPHSPEIAAHDTMPQHMVLQLLFIPCEKYSAVIIIESTKKKLIQHPAKTNKEQARDVKHIMRKTSGNSLNSSRHWNNAC
jgi:hypothetical protein